MNMQIPATAIYGNGTLPQQIRSRMIGSVNGLAMHVLEAGFEFPDRPCVLLLHGFPEIAYSWRKLMLPLAAAGYHVLAPDRRGYGRTTGWDDRYDTNLAPFGVLNRIEDMVALLHACGYSHAAVVGHDFGATLAGWCALTRPSVFRAVVMMSSPFEGPSIATMPVELALEHALATLPSPRKVYTRYYSRQDADPNMRFAPAGIRGFLRAYFHYKSADWPGNVPYSLKTGCADELAALPTYYIMALNDGMAETVAAHAPTAQEISACSWLDDLELDIYASEYARTGFQGGLNEYRCEFDDQQRRELRQFSNQVVEVPALFIGGRSDWGVRQTYGALEFMMSHGCTDMRGVHTIDGAGHWVQQEQPKKVIELLLNFFSEL